jgi:putative ABC transport system permease protein
MIRHVLALMWQRKGANSLIILELLVTFLILFCLSAFTLNLYRLYRQPLGFNVDNTWSIQIAMSGAWQAVDSATFRQVLAVIDQMDEVQAAGLITDPPFTVGGSSSDEDVRDVYVRYTVNALSPDLPEALGMQLVEGRWFGPQDDNQVEAGITIIPVLVNQAFSAAVGGDVLGLLIPIGPTVQQRIVGVFEDFRQDGEFYASTPFMMQRLRAEVDFAQPPVLVLVVKPGVSPQFEENLQHVLQRAAPGWNFYVDSWVSLQQAHFRTFMIPLLITGIVVLFLLLMVGLGLLGVLWQNVVRRTPEMGLRRAMGATANAVRLQVVLELLAVVLFALALGFVIVVQFPLSGILQALDWALFIPAATLSAVLLLALCILFALYPSYQATRQDPVEALRYE